jgi:hypothetical protein
VIRRVGIDLDNTIIDYDAVFVEAARQFGHSGALRSKSDVRDLVRTSSGDESWQRVQGWVYGEGIHQAVPYWGIHEFLRRCSARGIEVFVVSHKTERGHFSSAGTSLRAVALEWLIREGMCGPAAPAIPVERVHFCDDRSAKIRRIAALELDVFIDDLSEVLTDPDFPDRTRRIGFRTGRSANGVLGVRSWREAGESVLGAMDPLEVVEMAAIGASMGAIERVAPAMSGGNSMAFLVHTSEGRFFVKRYPDRQLDPRRRCETETSALRWMGEHGLPVPNLISADDSLGLAVHGFVEGSSIDQPSVDDVERAADFVERLAIHAKEERPEFDDASEHFGSPLDLIDQVERRLVLGERSDYEPCAEFFRTELRPAFQREATRIKTVMGGRLERSLPIEARTLSPSDFGFHNALRTRTGIVFVDFEYFGWDDPAKLVCDFLLHPGFRSTRETQGRWLERVRATFGPDVVDRAIAMLPLTAIRWEAIILKPFVTSRDRFDDDDWTRRLERIRAVRTTALSWQR